MSSLAGARDDGTLRVHEIPPYVGMTAPWWGAGTNRDLFKILLLFGTLRLHEFSRWRSR